MSDDDDVYGNKDDKITFRNTSAKDSDTAKTRPITESKGYVSCFCNFSTEIRAITSFQQFACKLEWFVFRDGRNLSQRKSV